MSVMAADLLMYWDRRHQQAERVSNHDKERSPWEICHAPSMIRLDGDLWVGLSKTRPEIFSWCATFTQAAGATLMPLTTDYTPLFFCTSSNLWMGRAGIPHNGRDLPGPSRCARGSVISHIKPATSITCAAATSSRHRAMARSDDHAQLLAGHFPGVLNRPPSPELCMISFRSLGCLGIFLHASALEFVAPSKPAAAAAIPFRLITAELVFRGQNLDLILGCIGWVAEHGEDPHWQEPCFELSLPKINLRCGVFAIILGTIDHAGRSSLN